MRRGECCINRGMKISIINRHQPWSREVTQLVTAGKRAGHEMEVRDVVDFNEDPTSSDWGDVIIWRSASIQKNFPSFELAKPAWLSLLRNKIIINEELIHQPWLSYKMAQQRMMQRAHHCRTIPTFHFHALDDLRAALERGLITYPFIIKPNKGAQGEGVRRIEQAADLAQLSGSIDSYVVQPWLENSGDYRVLMVGGVMVGAMKRVRGDGSHLNNIAQGAQSQAVTDEHILARLRLIANEVMDATRLAFFGIDILYSEGDKQWYFLEVNTIPEWQAFQDVTGVDIPGAVINLCESMSRRSQMPMAEAVKSYYMDRLAYLAYDKQFHFLNRLYIWSGDQQVYKRLQSYRQWYTGDSASFYRVRLQSILAEPTEMQFISHRSPMLRRYPKLLVFNKLLFRMLHSRTLYGVDLTPVVKEVVSLSKLSAYDAPLRQSPADVAMLSTYAVNYLWLLSSVQDRENQDELAKYVLDIFSSHYDLTDRAHVHLALYLLTHAIIGQSQFYTRLIHDDHKIYEEMLRRAEQLVSDHYIELSLDAKCEFLLCARILGVKTPLEPMIMNEASHSWSPAGNFIIDVWNTQARDGKKNVDQREHMNVLFLMLHLPWAVKRPSSS